MAKELELVAAPEVVDVEPLGTCVLVERLTDNEILGTKLHIPTSGKDKASTGAPQAYILKLGPMVDPKFGLRVGARCVLSGSYTPLPEGTSKSGRQLGLLEPHMIKAILIEKQ